MSTNLQNFSPEELSEEFIARFSSKLFVQEIDDWFIFATESILNIYINSSRFTSKQSNQELAKATRSMNKSLEASLIQSIRSKQKSQKNIYPRIDWSKLIIGPSFQKIHSEIVIFDWIHDYSAVNFPREIDFEMIHLVFDFIGISTHCACKFENENKSKLTFNQLQRLMLRTTSYNGTIIIRELKSTRFMEILEFYQSSDGIKLSDNSNPTKSTD
jgi:hypothetical protein